MPGIEILNTGQGDTRIQFQEAGGPEPTDERTTVMPESAALTLLRDLQRQRGYAVLVELPDGTMARAIAIDPEQGTYTVVLSLPAEKAEVARVVIGADEPSANPAVPAFLPDLTADEPPVHGSPGPCEEAPAEAPGPCTTPGCTNDARPGFDTCSRSCAQKKRHAANRARKLEVPAGETNATAIARSAGG